MSLKFFDWDLTEFRELGQVRRRQTRRIDGPPEFIKEFRSFCPKPGDDYQKCIMVRVHPGDHIGDHTHPEHALLWYVEPAGVPVIVGGVAVLPEPGQVLYIPPNVRHSVPKNNGKLSRVSIAMLVEP